MKFVATILFFTSFLFSASIQWEKSLFDAKIKSAKTLKPIMILLTRDDCPWCIKLLKTTLKDPDVINSINIKYIPVHLVNGAENARSLLGSGLTPRVVFIHSTGPEIYSIPGYWNADEFKDGLDDADEALASTHPSLRK